MNSMIPLGLDGVLRTPGQQMAALHRQVVDLSARQSEGLIATMTAIADGDKAIRALIPSDEAICALVVAGYAAERERLEKLHADAVSILNLLVDKGIVSRDELNAAVG